MQFRLMALLSFLVLCLLSLMISGLALTAKAERDLPSEKGEKAADSKYASEGKEVQAKSPEAADREFFGDQKTTDGHTSHFNFDNRVFSNDPNPPRSDKFRCFVECVLDNGNVRQYSSSELTRIPVGEYRTLDINALNARVVKCRFSWRLRPLGLMQHSRWEEAPVGRYFSYVFLIWHGQNDYTIEPTYEVLAEAKKEKNKE